MAVNIGASVGKNGVNKPVDVKAIQAQLPAFLKQLGLPPISPSGVLDFATMKAIDDVQRKLLKLKMPDGKIDPGGKTLKFLNTPPKPILPGQTAGGAAVTYKADVPASVRLVSDYAIKVIQRALGDAGMSAGVITSTLRLPAEQAGIMYDKCKLNIKAQYQLYGNNGDQVIDVFDANKTQPRSAVVALMQQKIEELAKLGKKVSRHVTTPEGYALLNVVDIGVNSTMTAAGPSFNKIKLTAAFNKLKMQGYIQTFIDETSKPNNCWHLEIVPNVKPL